MARKGLDAEVYEQAPELKEVGAGVGLWGNAFRALRAIGLADEVVRLAGGPAGSGVKRPDGAWLLYQPHEVAQKRWGAGFASVHRAELHRLLADQVDPTAIHLDARCTGISDAGDVVRARFADGREVEADVLVGADGAHSVVRTALLGPAPIRYRGYTTAGALTPAGSVPVPRDGSETWGRGIRFGVAPTSGERVVWYAVWKAPGETGVSKEHLLRLFGSWHEPVRAVIEATPPDMTVRKDVYDRLPGRTWTRGRVALIGDAIHLMTPDLRQAPARPWWMRSRWPTASLSRVASTPSWSTTSDVGGATPPLRPCSREPSAAWANWTGHSPVARATRWSRRCRSRSSYVSSTW